MIVPEFWAEARVPYKLDGRRLVIRRFGWSDESEEDAQTSAGRRAREAIERIRSGEKLANREKKIAYNGTEGIPIREEIVSRHGDTVITRNSYGAKCLNTPDVLFADVDFNESLSLRWWLGSFLSMITISVITAVILQSVRWGIGLSIFSILFSYWPASLAKNLYSKFKGGVERQAQLHIDKFISSHPEWHLRIYRTPAGLRVLAMHRTFDPNEDAVKEFFQSLGTDRIYQRMCQRQQCFRARVSPKPWRIGIGDHLKPHPGIWPIKEEHLPRRNRWLEEYDAASEEFASCRFVEAVGSSTTDPKALAVQQLHDKMSKVESKLPIA